MTTAILLILLAAGSTGPYNTCSSDLPLRGIDCDSALSTGTLHCRLSLLDNYLVLNGCDDFVNLTPDCWARRAAKQIETMGPTCKSDGYGFVSRMIISTHGP